MASKEVPSSGLADKGSEMIQRQEKFILSTFICILAFIINGCTEFPDKYFNEFSKEGNEYFEQGNYIAALNVWLKAAEIKQDDAVILKKIGKTYLRLMEPQNAEKIFARVVQLQPAAWNIWLELARIKLLSWDIKAADEICKKILNSRPSDIGGLILRGDIEAVRGDLYAAELDYKIALSHDLENQLAMARLCICMVGQQNYHDAHETYEKLSALVPKEAEILLQMANYLKLTEQKGHVEKLYQNLIEDRPEELSVRIALAEFYASSGQNKKALEVLAEITKIVPENRFVKKKMVKILLSDGQIELAGDILDAIKGSNAVDIELEMLKGEYHLMMREPELAIANYNAVVGIEPEFAQAHYFLGLSYLSGGKNQLGYQSLVRALAIDNDFSDAELVLADYYYKEGEYDSGLEHALRITQKEPENYRAYLIAGNILIAKKEFEEAKRYLNFARIINPDSFSPAYFLGMAAELTGEIEEALKFYESILEDDHNLNNLNQRYAKLLMRLGRNKDAMQHFEKILKRMPDNGYAHLIMGDLYVDSGLFDEAIASFKKAIMVDSTIEGAYLRLAEIFGLRKQTDEQKAVFLKAIENNREFSAAYVALAGIYMKEGNIEKAIEIVRQAYNMNRGDPLLANNLAALYLENDVELNVAFGLAQTAYEKFPDSPAVADTIGLAYYKKGLMRQAVWYLENALRLKTKGAEQNGNDSCWDDGHIEKEGGQSAFAIIHFHLGMAHAENSDNVDALAHLQSALELGLEDRDRGMAEVKIAQLNEFEN